MSRWTHEEEALLASLAGVKCAREIAAMVGRPRFATIAKMQAMGLKGMPAGRQAEITPAQLDELRKVKPGISGRQFAAKHGLGDEQVRHWARKLGVKFVAEDRWTPEDCAELLTLAGQVTAAEAGARLGRPPGAVRYKAAQLGIALRPARGRRKPKPAKPKRTPIALVSERAASAPKPRREEPSRLEWCKECHAPVSNWQEHYERMGHRRSA